MEALEDNGITVPKALQEKTNFSQNKYYDQIAFKADSAILDFVEGQGADGRPNAGVFKLFESIMKADDWQDYKDEMLASDNGQQKDDQELETYFRAWKTYQFSDHFPLWARLRTNNSDQYLSEMQQDLEQNH